MFLTVLVALPAQAIRCMPSTTKTADRTGAHRGVPPTMITARRACTSRCVKTTGQIALRAQAARRVSPTPLVCKHCVVSSGLSFNDTIITMNRDFNVTAPLVDLLRTQEEDRAKLLRTS
jgi:hypothetical protein